MSDLIGTVTPRLDGDGGAAACKDDDALGPCG